ncbi:hypothetical protein G9A89_001167 [Geosiphon pyriformis]|nr:hypothetical protein G9A89_001167 [Geosiphon pyriformis]
MEMATSLAREKEIDINSDLKRQGMKSDQAVVIKKILIDTLKDMIVAIDSVHIAKAFRVLLFTLLMEMITYDLGTLLERTGGKTCIINRSMETGNKIHCAVVGFEFDNDLEFAFYTELILGGWIWFGVRNVRSLVILFWNVIHLLHSPLNLQEHLKGLHLMNVKKSVPISHPAAFGGKSWAQVVSLTGSSDGFHFVSGSGSPFSGTSGLNNGLPPVLVDNSFLDAHLVSLEQSLELLTNQQHEIGAASFSSSSKVSATLIATKKDLVLDVVIDNSELVLSPPFFTFPSVLTLGLNSSKVLTTKIGSLEFKLMALKASIVGKFEDVHVFTFGLNFGYLGAGIVVVIDFFLAKHVCKISEMPSWLLSIRLLFKNKLSVSVLGLYTGVLSAAQFLQTGEINSLIAKAANESFFVVLDGDFNEDSLKKSASFKNDYFNTDHRTVFVSVDLGGLLDTQLNFLCRQANKNHWKFDFKGANNAKKKWSKSYDDVFIKEFFKFHKLELLVLKIAKTSHKKDVDRFALLMKCWNSLDNVKASIVQKIVNSDAVKAKIDMIIKGWTRKHNVVRDFSNDWSHQYQPLEYIFDDAFSNVICLVDFDELLGVVFNLSDSKAAGLSEVSNKLWKHCDKLVLDMLLVLLNSCLSYESMFGAWKEAWVSIIPKPYEWERVFMNTQLIALIETVHKILSKILLNSIFLACSSFDVLRGDNFSVFKSMTIQSLIFAIGSIIENALEKNHADVRFFANLVLKKAISDKQFSYLVSAVLHPIVNYRTQFSFVLFSICNKYGIAFVEQLHYKNRAVFNWRIFKHWKKLDPHGPVSEWFKLFIDFLDSVASSPAHFLPVVGTEHFDILESSKFELIYNQLLELETNSLSIYMNGSLKRLGSVDMRAGAVDFFEDISLDLGVRVSGLMFSTLAELQTITLAFECVLLNSLVGIYSDSQTVLDACKSELGIVYSDFRNCCWIEH